MLFSMCIILFQSKKLKFVQFFLLFMSSIFERRMFPRCIEKLRIGSRTIGSINERKNLPHDLSFQNYTLHNKKALNLTKFLITKVYKFTTQKLITYCEKKENTSEVVCSSVTLFVTT